MKLYGNTSTRNKKTVPEKKQKVAVKKEPRESRKAAAQTNEAAAENGLLYKLAAKKIEKAKTAIDDDEYGKRTPEEKKSIEADIVRYQKKKILKRIIAVLVVLAIVIAGIAVYKVNVRPPEIGGNNSDSGSSQSGTASAPNPANTAQGTAEAQQTDTGNESTEDGGNKPIAADSQRQEGMYTFLVIGNDQGNGNTDTMFVGRIDTVNKTMNIVNIPRDTLVNVPWSVKKVNTILAFRREGMEGLVDGISDILGFEVDSYISVDLQAFIALVDTIGGVYFDVPMRMDYDDPTQDLHIHVAAGYQLLDGETAEGVVRFRSGYAAGDIKRISVQQDFLKALAKQCLSIGTLTANIADYAKIFKDYVDTDLSIGNLVWYGQQLSKLEVDSITFQTLPANYNDSVKGLSYCSINIDEWLEMINTSLSPFTEEITVEQLNILTRNSSGGLYSTTGTIAGGANSFYDATALLSQSDTAASEAAGSSAAPSAGENENTETAAQQESTGEAASEPADTSENEAAGTEGGETAIGEAVSEPVSETASEASSEQTDGSTGEAAE